MFLYRLCYLSASSTGGWYSLVGTLGTTGRKQRHLALRGSHGKEVNSNFM